MVIVSQDRKMFYNYDNIEAVGIGNPLENNDGKFTILIETTSDNQYPIAEYESEERAQEVLMEIVKRYSKALMTINRELGQRKFYDLPKVYYMPEK